MTAHVAVGDATSSTGRDAPRWLSVTCVVASVVAASALALVVLVHVDDRYAVDHASGARISLARYAAQGVLYPALVDADSFGGTRFMPLPVLLHAAGSLVTGEYLISGKVVALVTMLAVTFVVLRVLRREGCPLPLAVGLVAVVLTTQTGLLALTGLRGDSLPLLLQLLAVAVVASSGSRRATWASAALAALAVTAKLHAVWAPVAIVVWLWADDRRRARDFAVAYVVLAIAFVGVLTGLTRGRLVENVLGLSTAGLSSPADVLSAPYRLAHLLVDDALGLWLLLPVAAAVVLAALRRRSVDPWQVSLVSALVVLLVVLGDIGTGANQLLDVAVLTVVVLGSAAGTGLPPPFPARLFRTGLSVAVLWAVVTGTAVTLAPAVRDALDTVRDPTRYRADPLAGVADSTTTLLSEDPYVPVSLDQDPVVLDPFMLPRIARDDPSAVEALVRRIDAQYFDLVVLVQPLDDDAWWADYHFGSDVIAAVERSYELAERVQGYDVYQPRPEA